MAHGKEGGILAWVHLYQEARIHTQTIGGGHPFSLTQQEGGATPPQLLVPRQDMSTGRAALHHTPDLWIALPTHHRRLSLEQRGLGDL